MTGRSEQEIFNELEDLCGEPGFVNAIAYFCNRDNMIGYDGKNMTVDNVVESYSHAHLSRAEISTLIGLLVKSEFSYDMPGSDAFQRYIDRADALFLELHHAINSPVVDGFKALAAGGGSDNPYTSGAAMREPIFYSGESAYSCQYRDLIPVKYRNDNDWFVANKGFSVRDAVSICSSINDSLVKRIPHVINSFLESLPPHEWTILPAFCFSPREISEQVGVDLAAVVSFLDSFVAPQGADNSGYTSVSHFNIMAAYPVIRRDADSYFVLQPYTLFEAIYETPFYWFNLDRKYKDEAMANRGEYAEGLAYDRLVRVFGRDRVLKNVNVMSGSKVVGEIDVLVVFANRAIVVQAKSKKLTVLAKQGNDFALKDDFKKSVQDAYEQGFLCAQFLNKDDLVFLDESGNEFNFPGKFSEIYLFCLVSDSYPALSFQSRQFLKVKESESVMHPFVMDVFLLDVMTEFLDTPISFLSYINRRVGYADKIFSTQELTILSYHLRNNLWIEDRTGMFFIHEDICADLDVAFLSRRDGIPGEAFPKGLLKKYKGTIVGGILNSIEHVEHHGTIELGFFLMKLSGATIDQIEKGVSYVARLARQDKRHHDFVVAIDEGNSGITFHLNDFNDDDGLEKLRAFCELRKYAQKANRWYGISINPSNMRLRFGVGLEYKWERDPSMEKASSLLPAGKDPWVLSKELRSKEKVGRNDPCPCGSGVKYKRCCLN